MQLPSPLISIAESAVQNAQDAGYFPLWPEGCAAISLCGGLKPVYN